MHPEASVVAIGPRARWRTADHPHDDAHDLAGAGGFEVIARDALAAGIGVRGHVGEADCHLFPARDLTGFAVGWIEQRFAG